MPRIRSVHPGLFTDEHFTKLPAPAQIFLIGLWTEADDQGVFLWRPRTLRLRLRPTQRMDVTKLLALLSSSGFVRAFEVDGVAYGAIRDFRKFQKPQKIFTQHPLPEELRKYVGLAKAARIPVPACAAPETNAVSLVEERREEEGREAEPAPPAFSDFSEDESDPSFEAFWRAYPTTPIMSKFAAERRWCELSAEDQARALAALPAYRLHCTRGDGYRPLNPDKFLFERRFDALGEAARQMAVKEEALAGLWHGRAAPLVKAMGAASFAAIFQGAEFHEGPPVHIAMASQARLSLAQDKCTEKMRELFGRDLRFSILPQKKEPVA